MDLLNVIMTKVDTKSIFLLLSVILMTRWLYRRPWNLPPEPYGWPIFGYIPHVMYAWYRGEKIHQVLERLGKKHGKIMSVNIFGTPCIVLNDASLIREAFQIPALCDKGFNNSLQVKLTGRCLMEHSTFKQYRTFCASTLRFFGVGKSKFEEHVGNEIKHLVKQLNRHNRHPIDPTELLFTTNANITCPVLFGTRFDYDDTKAQELLSINWAAMQLLGQGGYEIFLPFTVPTNANKTLWSASKLLFDFIDTQHDEHQKAFDPEDLSDYTDVYLNEIKQKSSDSRNSHLHKDNIKGMLYFLFMAGADPVTSWIHWALVYLAAYPDVQKRVHKELDTVVGRDRIPKMSDQPSLPYLKAVIHEIQRIVTMVPIGHIHSASAHVQFHGYTIPKGSCVISNLWYVHNNPDVWPNPEQFKPERFLNNKGEFVARDNWIPFGTGRRNCLGENLAKIGNYLFITHLLHYFTFTKPRDQSTFDFTGSPGLIRSPTGQKIVFTERG